MNKDILRYGSAGCFVLGTLIASQIDKWYISFPSFIIPWMFGLWLMDKYAISREDGQ